LTERGKKELLQMMIKDIIYGRQEIVINLFYLPAIDRSSKKRSEMLPLLNKYRTISIVVKNKIINNKGRK